MARHKFEKVFQDGSGNGVASGTISVYLAGTTTAASVYEAESGGSPVSSVTSGSDGVFYFWVDDATYTHSQLFKIIISKSGYSSKTYDSLRIYPPLSTEIFIGSVANKTVDDLFDGGYDVAIKPSKIFGGASNTSGHTVPNAADDTFVLKDATQTLTLKTLTSPVVNSPTIDLVKAPSGTTNGHTVPTVADDTFALLAASQNFTTKTYNSHTMPTGTADTIALLAASQNFTNKTYNSHTLPTGTADTIALLAASQNFTTKTYNGHTMPGGTADTVALIGASQTLSSKTLDSSCSVSGSGIVSFGSWPVFSVHNNGVGITLTAGAWTKLTWSSEEFDVGATFASNKFTPAIAGYYQLNFSVYIAALVAGKLAQVAVYKNGTVYKVGGYQYQQTTGDMAMNGSVVVSSDADDYFEIFAYHNDTVDRSTSGSAENTYFNGSRVG